MIIPPHPPDLTEVIILLMIRMKTREKKEEKTGVFCVSDTDTTQC